MWSSLKSFYTPAEPIVLSDLSREEWSAAYEGKGPIFFAPNGGLISQVDSKDKISVILWSDMKAEVADLKGRDGCSNGRCRLDDSMENLQIEVQKTISGKKMKYFSFVACLQESIMVRHGWCFVASLGPAWISLLPFSLLGIRGNIPPVDQKQGRFLQDCHADTSVHEQVLAGLRRLLAKPRQNSAHHRQ